MSGSVFLYNLFNEPGAVSLNGGQAKLPDGTVAPTISEMGPKSSGYAPSYIEVGSAIHDSDDLGSFYRGGEGVNSFIISWDSGKGTSSNFLMPTTADQVSVDDDLLCYVTRVQAVVLNTRGMILRTNTLSFMPFTL